MMPPSTHSPISASKMQMTIDCPASRQANADLSEGQTTYAAEGVHLHFAVERHLKTNPDAPVRKDVVVPHLDQEQRDVVQDCVDYLDTVRKTLPEHVMNIELTTSLKEFNSILFEAGGTCDIVLTAPNIIHVLDWKFGKGIPVYADDNDQMYSYIAGAAYNWDVLHSFKELHVHVVQPRLDNYDHIILEPDDIMNWLEQRIIPGVTRSYEKNPPYCAGVNQCRWCKVKTSLKGCPAHIKYANRVAKDVFALADKGPDATLEEISKIVQEFPLLEACVKDFRLVLQRNIENGNDVPGWKMVSGRSTRRWYSEQDAIDFMTEHISYDDMYKSKLISVAQAEKAFRPFKQDSNFHDLVDKPEGKPTLVQETDRRAALDYRTAEEKFAHLLEDE